MGGFLVYQSCEPSLEIWDNAVSFIVQDKGMPLSGQVDSGKGTRAAKFDRTMGAAFPIWSLESSWLVTAGVWTHPDLGLPDDGQWLLEELETNGASVLDCVDGMYAVAWYCGTRDELLVATDHLGRLHLYRAALPSGVLIGTSSCSLATAVGADLDPRAVVEFLSTGTIYEERTPFRRVERMGAGQRVHFSQGRSIRSTSAPGSLCLNPKQTSSAQVLDVCRSVIAESGRCWPKPLADLTGGQDSRLVVGFLLEALGSLDVTVSGSSSDRDVEIAQRLADEMELRLLLEEPRPLGRQERSFDIVLQAAKRVEGEFDAIEYSAIAATHQSHSLSHSASINGSGGEMLRNYWWSSSDRFRRRDAQKEGTQRFIASRTLPDFLDSALEPHSEEPAAEMVSRALEAVSGIPFSRQMDHLYLYLRMQCWQGSIAGATNEIWPASSPLLNRGILEVALGLQDRDRLHGRLFGQAFAALGPPFSTVPFASGLVPAESGIGGIGRRLVGAARFLARRTGVRLTSSQLQGGGVDAVNSGLAALMDGGGRDYLAPDNMRLLPVLNKQRYGAFLASAAKGNGTALAGIGRLVSFEHALRLMH